MQKSRSGVLSDFSCHVGQGCSMMNQITEVIITCADVSNHNLNCSVAFLQVNWNWLKLVRDLWNARSIQSEKSRLCNYSPNLQIAQIKHAHYSWHRKWLLLQKRDERRQDNEWWQKTTCVSAPEQLARWPVNRIGEGQHGVVSTALCHFIRSNFPRARREAHDTQAYT